MSQEKLALPMVRRPERGELLVLSENQSRQLIFYPYHSSPKKCLVHLKVGDEVRLSYLPAALATHYQLADEEMAKIIAPGFVSLLDHPELGTVPLVDFVGWPVMVMVTVLHLVEDVMYFSPSLSEPDFL